MNTYNKFLATSVSIFALTLFLFQPARALYVCKDSQGVPYIGDTPGPCDSTDYRGQNKPKEQSKNYTGERLTVDYESIDFHAFIKVLQDFTGISFVVSNKIQGNIAIRQKNIQWDELLDKVLIHYKLMAKNINGTIYVGLPNEF